MMAQSVPLTILGRSGTSFPRRALIGPGFLPEVRQVLLDRGVTIIDLVTPLNASHWSAALRLELRKLNLCSTDLVVALPGWVDLALEELGITVPPPPDYPDCLTHLLRRRVWRSTLGEVHAELGAHELGALFIKPAEGAKAFSGCVVHGPSDGMLDMLLDTSIFPACGAQLPVHCSEVKEMNAEYAVFVVDGEIRSICHYMCKQSSCRCANGERARLKSDSVVELDMDVVHEAVRRLQCSNEMRALTGYRADFALVRVIEEEYVTALVEVNDGYVSGRYDGMSPQDFTDMVVSRFHSLQSPPPEMHGTEEERYAAALSSSAALTIGTAVDKVLFLDVDGVLACRRSLSCTYADGDPTLLFDPKKGTFSPLERRCVSELVRVVDATGCAVVLSTSWRLDEGLRQFLVGALAEKGVAVIGDTPSLPSSQGGRGAEVAAWLASAKHAGSWCILDDGHAKSFKLAGMTTRLVVTYMDDGLTPALADEAIRLLLRAGDDGEDPAAPAPSSRKEGNEHLLLPVDVAARRAAYEALVVGTYPQMHEILPRLYLGSERAAGVFREGAFEDVSAPLAATLATLRGAGVTHILNCTDEKRVYDEANEFHYLNISFKHRSTQEASGEDFLLNLPRALRFIHSARTAGRSVLVHCNNGKNRSASVVTAYVMMYGRAEGWSAAESYAHVRGVRGIVETSLADKLLEFDAMLQEKKARQDLDDDEVAEREIVVHIRDALPSDAAAIFNVVNAAYAIEKGATGLGFKRGDRYGDISATLVDIDAGRVIVAVDRVGKGDIVIGCAAPRIDNTAIPAQCDGFGPFAVATDVQRRGVGNVLLAAVEARCVESGVERINISVVNHRVDLLRWYTARGFAEYGTAPTDAAHNCDASQLTRPSHFILMTKTLDPC